VGDGAGVEVGDIAGGLDRLGAEGHDDGRSFVHAGARAAAREEAVLHALAGLADVEVEAGAAEEESAATFTVFKFEMDKFGHDHHTFWVCKKPCARGEGSAGTGLVFVTTTCEVYLVSVLTRKIADQSDVRSRCEK
jgi:hypothetical protein